MVAPSVPSSWPLTHRSHCWLWNQVSPEEREEGHKVFKWGSGSAGREQGRAGLLGTSRGPRSLVGGGGRLEVEWRPAQCTASVESGPAPGARK